MKKTQLSIGKNEETEIKFNFNSGTGKVFAILIPKSQNDGSYNSIIFDENTSNLLSFNANSLRLTKEDTEICDGGCDLIIQMSVEGATEEFVEVSITKDPINAVQPGEKEDDGDDKGVKPWLVAVIVIVCVVGSTLLYPLMSIAFSVTSSRYVLLFTTLSVANSLSVPCSL